MTINATQVGDKPSSGRRIAIPTKSRDGPTSPATVSPKEKREYQLTNMKFFAAAGIVAATLATAFKDGIKEGLYKVGSISSSIGHMISVPFSFFFPYITLKNEYDYLKGGTKSGDESILNRMVYSCASLSFMPVTFSEPLLSASRSTGHLISALLNMPHILFTLLSYTGGRFLGAMKFLEKAKNTDPKKEFRLEQEFNSLYKLGNLGSAQASVTPLAKQCNLGLGTLKDLITGDFGSAMDRFRAEPFSVMLGVLFNWWIFPLEWAAKFLDTTIRCAENIDQYKHAFPKNAWVINKLEDLKKNWHIKAKDRDSLLGNFLYYGREFAKVESLLLPPIGMVSVVIPTFNKFLKGEFFNKEAQGIGGFIGFFDKIFSSCAFLGHIYHTGLYALTIRLPQTITTATFYGCNLLNRFRGKKLGDEGFLEPIDVRSKIFNRPFINKISNWAEKKLNKIETEINPNNPTKINSETKESKYIRDFTQIMAEEVIWEPIKEAHYAREVERRGEIKPPQEEWGKYLQQNRESIVKEFEQKFETYLRESPQFTSQQINYMKKTDDWVTAMAKAEALLNIHIKTCLEKETENKPSAITPDKVQIPKSFWGLLSDPKALWEVLKLRTFNAPNTILPLFIRGFVNVVDFGKRDEEFWYRNFKAQETGIREGDYIQATDREFLPVVWHSFQNAGSGMAKLYHTYRLLMHGEPMPANEPDYSMAA